MLPSQLRDINPFDYNFNLLILNAGKREEYKHELIGYLKQNNYTLNGSETVKTLERMVDRLNRKLENNGR